MNRIARAAGLVALTLIPVGASAQLVRGNVKVRGDTTGVSGVVVLLLDSTGATVGRALTDARGDYRIVAPGAGTYRLRTMRVGFRPDTSAAIELGAGQERHEPLIIASVAARLDTVRVASRSQCRNDAGDVTAAIWDQARTAMQAAQITAGLRSVNATIITFERTLDPNSERVREQTSEIRSGLTVRPWASLPPDSLRKVGYIVAERDGSFSYLAPDLDALLSPGFVGDHCFRVVRTRDTTVIGVAFGPGRDRARIPEIEGTLWLDRQSAGLKRLEFRYANAAREQTDRAGGDMEFALLRNGSYAISRWMIKMPVLERAQSVGASQIQTRVAELRAVGGELSYAINGDDTLFARAPLLLHGVVLDSTSGKPVPGAKVALSGTNLEATADGRGRFGIEEVLPGEYVLEIRTPDYEDIKAVVRWPLIFVDSRPAVTLRVPSVQDVFKAKAATFTGIVVDSAGAPLAGTEIAIPQLGVVALTDPNGAFRVGGIPPGDQEVTARRLGYGPLTATVQFPERRTVDRRIVLTRLTVLDSVVVTAESPMVEFSEHMKVGLGKFFTRQQLEKLRGRSMSSVMSEVKGVGIVFGHNGHGYMQSTRATSSVSIQQGMNKCSSGPHAYDCMRKGGFIPPHIWCPDGTALSNSLGLKCGCYTQVWLDRSLLNPGEPTEPFDVNSIPPEMIEAMEYYASSAQAPMRYSARNGQCGVLVIHSRRFEPKGDSTRNKAPG